MGPFHMLHNLLSHKQGPGCRKGILGLERVHRVSYKFDARISFQSRNVYLLLRSKA